MQLDTSDVAAIFARAHRRASRRAGLPDAVADLIDASALLWRIDLAGRA